MCWVTSPEIKLAIPWRSLAIRNATGSPCLALTSRANSSAFARTASLPGRRATASMRCASPSRSLIARVLTGNPRGIEARFLRMLPLNSLITPSRSFPMRIVFRGCFLSNASFTALSNAFETFSPLVATVGITGTPSFFDRRSGSGFAPLFKATSYMFRITSTGYPSSTSCSVRYRFRPRLEASAMLTMMSGFCSRITRRATSSSSDTAPSE